MWLMKALFEHSKFLMYSLILGGFIIFSLFIAIYSKWSLFYKLVFSLILHGLRMLYVKFQVKCIKSLFIRIFWSYLANNYKLQCQLA